MFSRKTFALLLTHYLGSNSRSSAVLALGTILNSLLGLAFYTLVLRNLTLADFGYFSYILGIGVLAAGLGDLGFGASIIKFGHSEKFRQVFTVAISEALIISALFFLLALVGELIFQAGLINSALIAFSLLTLSMVTQSFLAKQKYYHFVITNICGNAVRIALALLAVFSGILSPQNALLIFTLANFSALIIGLAFLFILEGGWLISFRDFSLNVVTAMKFSSWLGGSYLLSTIVNKIDIPLVYALAGPAATGIYSSAQKLSSVFPQLVASVEGVFTPKFSRDKEITKSFKDYLWITAGLVALLILAMLLSPFVINLLFGQKYAGAVGIFVLLLIGMVFFSLAGPYTAKVVYYLGRTDLHLLSSVLQLFLGVILYFLLIPPLGADGAAITFIAVNIFLWLFFWFISRDR